MARMPSEGVEPADAVKRKRAERVAAARASTQAAYSLSRIPEDHPNPLEKVTAPSPQRRSRAFTDAELASWLAWLPTSELYLTVRNGLRPSLLTGCRSGEAVAARWADMTLDPWVRQLFAALAFGRYQAQPEDGQGRCGACAVRASLQARRGATGSGECGDGWLGPVTTRSGRRRDNAAN
jgi:hypothetical protein